jgi:tRNA(Ile)-lysidine synthase
MQPLEEAAAATIRKHSLLDRGDVVVVGVSGGPDSVALLAFLHEIAAGCDLDLRAAHLNHRIRGEQADEDERFVVWLCGELDVPLKSGSVDVPAVAAERGISIEEAARDERRKMLHRAAVVFNARRIALGHTAADQAETVLMNLIRGAGTAGMAGIRPIQDDLWIRPLLHCTRGQVLDYLRRRGFSYRIDSSNFDTSFLRNRVRHDLLPLLEREYRAGIAGTLARNADLIADDLDFLRGAAAEALPPILLHADPDRIELDLAALRSLHKALRRRVVLLALERVRGSLVDVEVRHIDRVLESDRAYGLTLPGGDVTVAVGEERLTVARRPMGPEYEIPMPGAAVAPELGICVTVEIAPSSDRVPLETARNQAIFDRVLISGPLRVRAARPADRLRPSGEVEAVPSDSETTTPIIADDDRVLWVVGQAASEAARVGPDTREVVIISVRPLGADGGGDL